ncbi:hypothetical protein HU200_003379 [Digitaria exilis]|uniref:Uncharacterized protein n=1 Tax=Digitaria exilis TaxID=1010633 RepID=A0A835FX41_9POAL|nr:hypothetical protein HU200_003379 [Digitaria exilis]
MSVAVKKSSPEVIRSPEPLKTTTTTMRGTIKLTSFDRFFVKESGANSDEESSIRCTGEGVEFIAASVGCGLQEAKIFNESTEAKALLDDLAMVYPDDGSYGSSDFPILSVQVTKFSCGGLVFGLTCNHAIADGTGIAQFLAAVGELARGSPSPSVVPARLDEAVSNFPYPSTNPMRDAIVMYPDSKEMDLIVPLDVTIPSALINRIKAKSHGCQPCTTFEAVLAVLWRATSGVVAKASVVELVRMIKRGKDQLRDKDDKMGNGKGGGGDGEEEEVMVMLGLGRRYDMMHVVSWRNMGLEQVDFGSGAPARVMFHARRMPFLVPTCVMYPPCKGKDGVNLLTVAVEEEHADVFLGELAKLEDAMTL